MRAEQLLELHGNAFQEECGRCGTLCVRHFDVVSQRGTDVVLDKPHVTGRKCNCSGCDGALLDTIVSFGDAVRQLDDAFARSKAAALFVVLGSSLKVTPAADLPRLAKEHGAKLVLVNKQVTDLDESADVLINADVDEVISAIDQAIELP